MGTKITAFGEVMMRLAAPSHLLLQQTNSLNVTYTGTGVNILSGLSKYGYHTSLITRLPMNSIGDAAIAHIRSLGIGTNDIHRGGKYIGIYFLEEGFDARPSKVTYSNRIESSFCTSHIADYNLDEIFKNTKIIHFCGITLAISAQTRKLALHVAETAKAHGITVVFDCNYRPKLWNYRYDEARTWYDRMLSYVDICLMTEKDAEYVLGMKTDETRLKDKRKDLLQRAAEKHNISLIAGTLRSGDSENETMQGFICHQSEMTYSRQYSFKVLDRIGAGDGFASGIIYGYDQQYSSEDIVEFATAAGVLAHTIYGDSPISTVDDVWALVHDRDKDIKR